MNNTPKILTPYIRAFIAGSAFPVVVWPFLYLGIPSFYNPSADFNFESAAITLPIMVGILNIVFVSIRRWLPFGKRGNYWFFGALHGLALSLYGNFVAFIPRDLFQLEGAIQHITIPLAVLAYSLIWRFIIRRLNLTLQLDTD